jgi:tetratricopeptide (TPR) repeat protein
MTRLLPLLLLFCFFYPHALRALPQATAPAADNANLSAADHLYRVGNFSDAMEKYQAILKTDSNSAAAQSGLIRSLLRLEKIDDAMTVARSALVAQPNSAVLAAAMGEVQFRWGQMAPAELSYRQAIKLDPANVDAYLGLARIYRAYSLYGHAYACLQRAHELSPDDPEVQRMWLHEVPRKDRVTAIEKYLAGPHADDPEETASLKRYLIFLKATAAQPHSCKLVDKIEQTDTKLEVLRTDPTHDFGVGLVVKVNGHDMRLQLDTGASGIVISRKAAAKAGLTPVSDEEYYGLGDNGARRGYSAIAHDIRVGDLEFHDCVVDVTDGVSVTSEDGLIGADVFSSYLIGIDVPDHKLKLSPLPQRPNEANTPATLKTEEESESGEDQSARDSKQAEPAAAQDKPGTVSEQPKPMDRYVAPEMKDWTAVFRFGSHLLIPTHIDTSPSMLFLIDTGSMMTMLSKREAVHFTSLHNDPETEVRGLNGSVSRVYRASKVTLKFGHLSQKNQGIISFDLANLSQHMGTEVSGILGFETLYMLQIKIDYRDGLVDFVYDAKRWER